MTADLDIEAMTWLSRHAERPLSPEEQAEFDAWYARSPKHQGAYFRAQAIWQRLDDASIVAGVRPLGADTALPRRPSGRRAFLLGGAAACVAASVVGTQWARSKTAVLTTTRGEFRKVPLADRSIANLNSDSHLEVEMTERIRRLTLVKGEAWFEVAKNPKRPFLVEAGEIRVQAVGTAFSVRCRDNGADVLVTEGVVEVWSDGRGQAADPVRHRLCAGEQAFVAADASPPQVVSGADAIDRKLAWREGNIALNNERLADAADEFNRYNARKIVISDPSLADKRFIGEYRADAPEGFASDVHTILGVPVRTTATTIYIGGGDSEADNGPNQTTR